jgi:hypothetical protein
MPAMNSAATRHVLAHVLAKVVMKRSLRPRR